MPDVKNIYNIKKVTVRTTVSPKTSSALEEEQKHHNLEALPEELRQQLDAIMRSPDFNPDMLALALEKARKETENTDTQEEPAAERCPWYETIARIAMLLGVTAFFFGLYMLVGILVVRLVDNLFALSIEAWINTTLQTHPVASIIVFIVAFLAFALWFLYLCGKAITESWKAE